MWRISSDHCLCELFFWLQLNSLYVRCGPQEVAGLGILRVKDPFTFPCGFGLNKVPDVLVSVQQVGHFPVSFIFVRSNHLELR